ncbi:FixH family protein [Cryomorpha ignava]|uniref:FixH family protein n=1 Tax=Cryomorpha ignava TaxID=101383 RepID=A0A7K3WLT2_9FLAO|nr:FixH family protein [Cryomorpha ignava]NEN22610.1 FixH family protein [Cryomorpha ignava]
MKFSSSALFMGLALMATTFVSCTSDDDSDEPINEPVANDLILINSAYTDVGSMLVNIYAADSLMAQYTKIYVEVKDSASNNIITNAAVDILPMMNMGTMVHSAPRENPTSNTATEGMYQGAVVFIMPGEMGWTLNVTIYDPANDVEGTAAVPVSVAQPAVTRTRVITPLDSTNNLIISYLHPQNPKVGVNDMEITIHERITGMNFTPVNDYSVSIDPEMPSMGHGSPNNVNPVSIGNGHYKGKVNFTMTGMWRINLDIYDGTTSKDTTGFFDITL